MQGSLHLCPSLHQQQALHLHFHQALHSFGWLSCSCSWTGLQQMQQGLKTYCSWISPSCSGFCTGIYCHHHHSHYSGYYTHLWLQHSACKYCSYGPTTTGPTLWEVTDKWHLEAVAAAVTSLEVARGTTANTNNTELLVDLVVSDLIHQVLNGDIKITRVLRLIGIEGQGP